MRQPAPVNASAPLIQLLLGALNKYQEKNDDERFRKRLTFTENNRQNPLSSLFLLNNQSDMHSKVTSPQKK